MWEIKGAPEETQDRNHLEYTPDSGTWAPSRWTDDPGVVGWQLGAGWGRVMWSVSGSEGGGVGIGAGAVPEDGVRIGGVKNII